MSSLAVLSRASRLDISYTDYTNIDIADVVIFYWFLFILSVTKAHFSTTTNVWLIELTPPTLPYLEVGLLNEFENSKFDL